MQESGLRLIAANASRVFTGCDVQGDPRFSQLDLEQPPEGADLAAYESILTINSSNWKQVVGATANADNQLMFSTFHGDNNNMLQMTANFYAWLHAGHMGNNVLYLSHDAGSCKALWKFGLPCWIDRHCPAGGQLPKGEARTTPS